MFAEDSNDEREVDDGSAGGRMLDAWSGKKKKNKKKEVSKMYM